MVTAKPVWRWISDVRSLEEKRGTVGRKDAAGEVMGDRALAVAFEKDRKKEQKRDERM